MLFTTGGVMRSARSIAALITTILVLAVVTTPASAGRFSYSEQRLEATFTNIKFTGLVDTIECEVVLAVTLHSRTYSKTTGSLVGYITEATVNRCSRGGATVRRETLPWHVQHDSFTGTLPAIGSIGIKGIGASFRIREPIFGFTEDFRSSSAEPLKLTFNRELISGTLISATVSGSIRGTTNGFTIAVDGTSSRLLTRGILRVTVTLI
jgi:hypothetical protein